MTISMMKKFTKRMVEALEQWRDELERGVLKDRSAEVYAACEAALPGKPMSENSKARAAQFQPVFEQFIRLYAGQTFK